MSDSIHANSLQEVVEQVAPSHPAMVRVALYPFGLTRTDVQRYTLLFIVSAAVLYLLYLVQDILPPFLIAFSLAALLDPLIRSAERKGRSRAAAIATIYLATILSLVLLGIIIGRFAQPQLEDITVNFQSYYANVERTVDSALHKNMGLLQQLGFKHDRLSDMIHDRTSPIQRWINLVLGGITTFLQDLSGKALWLIIVPVAGFFLMLDYPRLRARLIALWPEPLHARLDEVSNRIVEVFSDYLRGLCQACLLFGIACFVAFVLLGVKYAIFLALLAAVFYAVPYVGQLVTAIVLGSIAYSMGEHNVLGLFHVSANSLPYALIAVGTQVTLNNVFDQVVYPKVVGGSVGLHPVVSIFALAAGATLFGLWGMLLAVPVAASIQIVLMNVFPKLTQAPPAYLLPSHSQSKSAIMKREE